MSSFDDDWMDNPVEMDDWINTLEEESKNVPRKSGGGPGGKGPGGGSGCLGAVIIVIGIIVLIALISTAAKPKSSAGSSHGKTAAITQETEMCEVSGCENKRIFGSGFRYCYKHTCESLGCKERVVSGSKYCSKHQPPKLGSTSNTGKSPAKSIAPKKKIDM